ncbi:STAS domain-containing protein [Brevibacillus dissolubilis]|uniref:STAS domain-containing protein n=1 Tax=Brevibacillus dissolubilis TaxID=1844116 RepID=UPI0011166C40|nr:STAS domain-containing protein [Brevibacillus dissolubilis]
MQYQVKEHEKQATIYLEGELDMTVGSELGNLIRQVGERHETIILDFDGVTFIDSSGIGSLFYATKDLLALGKAISITNVKEDIRDILEVLGFAEALGLEI